MSQRLSVVIPAHNEERLIGRLLAPLAESPERDRFDIVVAANGCTDGTAERARSFPGVTVVEVAEGSKIAALNAGDAATDVFPRVYLDADVSVSPECLLALADALAGDLPRVAAPTLRVETRGASWLVRQYYRIWDLTAYRTKGHIGSGIYAVSEAGRSRFGEFPQVIADDRYVQRLFAPEERITLADWTFTVESPRTLRSVIRRGTRITVGSYEIADKLGGWERASGERQNLQLLKSLRAKPGLWVPFAVYYATSTLTRRRAQRVLREGGRVGWNQDRTTRVGAGS